MCFIVTFCMLDTMKIDKIYNSVQPTQTCTNDLANNLVNMNKAGTGEWETKFESTKMTSWEIEHPGMRKI